MASIRFGREKRATEPLEHQKQPQLLPSRSLGETTMRVVCYLWQATGAPRKETRASPTMLFDTRYVTPPCLYATKGSGFSTMMQPMSESLLQPRPVLLICVHPSIIMPSVTRVAVVLSLFCFTLLSFCLGTWPEVVMADDVGVWSVFDIPR